MNPNTCDFSKLGLLNYKYKQIKAALEAALININKLTIYNYLKTITLSSNG